MNKEIAIFYLMVGFSVGVGLQELRLDATINKEKQIHADYVALVANAATEAVQAHAAEAARQQKAVAEIDYKYTQELADAERKANKLLNSVRDGERRLYVATAKATNSCGVSATAAATGMDDGASKTELDRTTTEQLIALTTEGDKQIVKLSACQSYICELHNKHDLLDQLGISNTCKSLISKGTPDTHPLTGER